MCGRYSASRPPDLTEETFAAKRVDEPPPPSWNVAPPDPVSVVVDRGEGRELRTYTWGLVPSWAEDARIASKLINARAETVATKSAFRTALQRRRCLVPADGWYEWRDRRPHFIHAGGQIAFAGLYERGTFTIVTTAASDELAWLHDRMPVVLPPDEWAEWLDPEVDEVGALLRSRAGFVTHPVSTDVNNVRNNGPSLVLPVEEEGTLF